MTQFNVSRQQRIDRMEVNLTKLAALPRARLDALKVEYPDAWAHARIKQLETSPLDWKEIKREAIEILKEARALKNKVQPEQQKKPQTPTV